MKDGGLEVVAKVADRVVGKPAGAAVRGIFGEHQAPDPIVPPDLRAVTPSPVDADGNVACLWCRAKVPMATAALVGSDGFVCATCNALGGKNPTVDPRVDLRGRRVWLWGSGILLAGAAIAIATWMIWQSRQRAARLRDEYPVTASSADEQALDDHAGDWDRGRISAALRGWTPPAIESLHLGGPCKVELATLTTKELDAANTDDRRTYRSFREMLSEARDPERGLEPWLAAGPDLADRAAAQVDRLLAAADRKRFRSIDAMERVVRTIRSPLVVVQLVDDVAPELVDRETFQPGSRRGAAYVFDPRTGTLACAGVFEAQSSPSVRALLGMSPAADTTHAALARDLEVATERAIASSMRAIAISP